VKRLYVAISHHGLGHLAQTAAVLSELHALAPDLEFMIRSALPKSVLDARLSMPFTHIDLASDCNLAMSDAIRVDVPASLDAYREFHVNWPDRVVTEARLLDALGVDMVYSNVGYLPLAAAQRVGLPNVALCSLNWADVFRAYLGKESDSVAIHAQMLAAYAGADIFLRPEPSMPMDDLGNTISIPAIASVGCNRHDTELARLQLNPNYRLVLIGMGGIRYRLPMENWPRSPGIDYLVPDEWQIRRPDVHGFADTGMSFADLLASSDALVTKPGYGSYVEAASAGLAVLTLARPDWPETVYLNDWLNKYARCMEIAETELLAGRLMARLERLWTMQNRPPDRKSVV
jgi:hypothetical protein